MSSDIRIRASSLSHWNDCPRRGAANSFRDIISDAGYALAGDRRSISAAIGTAVHAGAAHTLKAKMEARAVEIGAVVDVSIAKLDEEREKGIEYDITSPSRNQSESQVKTLAESFHAEIAPKVKPVAVETSLSGTVSYNGMVIQLTGHPDAIETLTLRDYKTSKSIAGYHTQLGVYHMLATDPKAGYQCENLVIDWLPRTSVSKPYPGAKTFSFPIDVCVAEAKAVIKSAMMQLRGFLDTQEPASFPCNRSSILCSAKFCPAFGTDFCEVSKL